MSWFSKLSASMPAAPELTPEDVALLTKIADKIVQRRMTVPAVMFFESVKPMNFVGAQVMIFLQPFITAFLTIPEYDRIRALLERRETLYRFTDLLEQREDDFLIAEKARKAAETSVREASGKRSFWKRLFGKSGK